MFNHLQNNQDRVDAIMNTLIDKNERNNTVPFQINSIIKNRARMIDLAVYRAMPKWAKWLWNSKLPKKIRIMLLKYAARDVDIVHYSDFNPIFGTKTKVIYKKNVIANI